MNIRYILTGAVIVGVLAGGVLFAKSKIFVESDATASTMPAAGGARTKGPAHAPVKIIEYSDFQCPACQRAQPVLEMLLSKYPNQIYLQYKHFPLSGHQWAAIAHQAAECSATQGKFWPYHDLLYGEQAKWAASGNPTEMFILYARDLGLNLDAFAACLADGGITKSVMSDKDAGTEQKVRSTPTFFINEKRFVGHRELEKDGQAYIREILSLPPEAESMAETPHSHEGH